MSWRYLFWGSIRKKLLFFNITMLIFCIMISVIISVSHILKATESDTMSNETLLAQKTIENIDFYLESINYISKNIALDENVLTILRQIDGKQASRETQIQVGKEIKKYKFFNNYITNIAIINEKSNIMYSYEYDYKLSFFSEKWYEKYIMAASTEYYTSQHTSIIHGTSSEGIMTFSHFKKIYDSINPSLYLATLVIEIDIQIINDSVRQLISDPYSSALLLLNNNSETIVNFADDSLDIQGIIEDIEIGNLLSTIITANNKKYIYSEAISDKHGWKIISIKDYKKIQEISYGVVFYIVLAGFTLLVFTILISIIVSKSITKPIAEIVKGVMQIEHGDMNVAFEVTSQDETAKLALVFNSMLENIKKLINDREKEERLKRKAEFAALQAQINPHFLYNTLDSINWSAVRKKDMELSGVITSLGKFFRISLNKGKEFVTVHDEIEHVKSYLDIQKFRKTYNFDYQICSDENVDDYMIPKLILQPLVENCLVHGLGEELDRILIDISYMCMKDEIVLKITDNGMGMPAITLTNLNNMLSNPDFNVSTISYGLKNVNERIKLGMGAKYGLMIESELSKGTTVIVTLPC